MTRAISLLVVVMLAAAPAWDTTWCLAWCAADAHAAARERAACHEAAPHAAAAVANDGHCGALLTGALFLRQEPRQEISTTSLDHGEPIARSRPMTSEGGRIGFLDDWTRDLAPPAHTAVLRI